VSTEKTQPKTDMATGGFTAAQIHKMPLRSLRPILVITNIKEEPITIPEEYVTSLENARTFLQGILANTKLPIKMRKEARARLKHLPSHMDLVVRGDEIITAARELYDRRKQAANDRELRV